MNIRRLFLLLCALGLGILILCAVPVSAQTGEAVRVISLSKSGYEQAFALTFSPDGKYFAVGGSSGIYLFDTQKLSEIDFIPTHARARSVLFLPGSNTLAAGLFDNTIKLWHIPEVRLMTTLLGHQGWVRSISVSGDGSLLASASDDDTVRIWKVSNGNLLLTLDKNTEGVRAVALSSDGALVAAALRDKTVRVWRVADGKPMYTLVGHTDWVRCLAFSPDGSLLASGSFDMTVRVWRVSDGKLLQTLQGHTSSILKVAFSPDGKTLASSSVDETVRLWQVSDGNVIRILHGYTDFIYALAFSPDGKTLASGGGDNAIRLWDLDALGKTTAATPVQKANPAGIQSITTDCRQCHHPQGLARPARVIDLSCENCHSDGANLEWCPAFPRSPEAVAPKVGYTPHTGHIGLPIGGDGIAVLITSPSNGETLYAQNGITAPAFIAGQVFPGKNLTTDLQVRLEVWSGNQITTTLTTNPSPTGQFKFNLSINPHGALPYIIKPGGADCVPCHEDYRPAAPLPEGEVRIDVTVSGPDNQQASDERWFNVDAGDVVRLPVEVVDDITGQPVPGLPVIASTVMYDWRARFGSAITTQGGPTQLNLEAHTLNSTFYNLAAPPTVYNGQLYSSDQPVPATLDPDDTLHPTVKVAVHAQSGHITGNLTTATPPASPGGVKIWAIQLPAGPAYQTVLDAQNTFAFDQIPVSQYLVLPDPLALSELGLAADAKNVDLLHSPQAHLSFLAAKSLPLSGNVAARDGSYLPFAWATVSGDGKTEAVNPASGGFLIPDLPSAASYLTVTAPGYYSQVQLITQLRKTADFQLIPRPETRHISWGDGQVIIPPETSVTINGLNISPENGWIWGRSSNSPVLTIEINGIEARISSSDFALENPVGGAGWLYLSKGHAALTFNDSRTQVEVESGQMAALVDGARAIPMDEAVIRALHPTQTGTPVSEVIEPSPGARVQTWLVRAGIGAAQIITFITYIISLVALCAIPVFVLFWSRKKRLKLAHSKEKH